MKCQIPEISWHNRDPVLSVDIQPQTGGDKGDFYRLASGGTDSHVLIWYMTQSAECGTISLDVVADLARHQRAVNAVRWSPNGELLASGDDESVIFIWKQKSDTEVVNILDTTNDQDKEIWLTMKILRGHMEDVYDLSWSPNSMFLISGSVDNTAMVWDINKGKSMHIYSDHKGFVQGVAWDPKNQYLATLSTDRYFRVFDLHTKKVLTRNNKCVLPVAKDSPLHGKTVRLYHDDTLQTFFRRLSFSPDGNLIVTPSGVAEIEGVPKPLNTTYIYTRNSLKQPAITLPSPDQYTVAVRFCPQYFKLRPHPENKPPIIPLPYRMIFAVATKSSVYLYDTQQKTPFALISNIHYTRLTDISWSGDGKILIVSSTDGFCSMISFNEGELGEIHVMEVDEAAGVEKEKTPTKKATSNRKKSKDGKDDEKKEVKKMETVPEEGKKDDSGKNMKPEAKQAEESKKEEKVAQPIAFRRKPKESEAEAPKKEEKVAQPIAFRRKPKEPEEKDESKPESKDAIKPTPIEIRRKPREEAQPAQPIAIKRKPKDTPEDAKNEPEIQTDESRKRPRSNSSEKEQPSIESNPVAVRLVSLESTDPKAGVVIKEIPPSNTTPVDEKIIQPAKEIIIETEKIISSDEKFDSPSRKNRPVTPIAVRRHPRTPDVTPSSSETDRDATPKTGNKNAATPIAVRRQPRNLTTSGDKSSESSSKPKPTFEEDAVDTWPIDQPKPVAKTASATTSVEHSSLGISEQTEDFKLVISDDEDPSTVDAKKQTDDAGSSAAENSDSDNKDKNQLTPVASATTPKTPRRVEFRTLSTPKSKKKLL
ncbi:chromatin assembly factor 1 subunit B [Aedes albopictus]|uniref:CAF1B/HIR1 beta-propeller domain-containing protein n=1 Tax=Aedes albopictus TaxID=7160 RepID=A0ABM2A4M4_AEDAL|nr:chromatin assembly factor 1 subunit B [Aedes albopictus]